MAASTRDILDDQAKLHTDQELLRWSLSRGRRNYRPVEIHYRNRLVASLAAAGITAVVTPNNHPHDLDIGALRVELKVALAHPHPSGNKLERYQADLNNPARRHHFDADLLIFLAVDPADQLYPYIIPAEVLPPGIRWMAITSHPLRYRGQWAPFLNRWELLHAGHIALH